jgi:hypothetical protein
MVHEAGDFMGFRAVTTRAEFDQFIRGKIARRAQVIKVAGIPQQ